MLREMLREMAQHEFDEMLMQALIEDDEKRLAAIDAADGIRGGCGEESKAEAFLTACKKRLDELRHNNR